MNAHQHISETVPGVIGFCIGGTCTIAGFLASATPILQVLSLVIGCAVGIVTFIYYLKQIRKKPK